MQSDMVYFFLDPYLNHFVDQLVKFSMYACESFQPKVEDFIGSCDLSVCKITHSLLLQSKG